VTAAVTYGNDLDVPGFGDGFSIAVIFLLCAIVPTALVLPFLPALHEPECRGADVRNVLVEVIARDDVAHKGMVVVVTTRGINHHVLVEVIE
jgi:hypothetical protein